MITWRATGYLLLTGLIYGSIVLFQVDVLVILFFLLIMLPFLSAFQLLIAKSSLQITQRLEPDVVEREETGSLVVCLHQNGWLSHGEIGLVIQQPGQRGNLHLSRNSFPLAGGNTAEIAFPMKIAHRGIYTTGLKRVESRDIFGLFRLMMMNRENCRRNLLQMTIVPKPVKIDGFESILARLCGADENQAVKIGDEVNDLANIRNRHPGESLKRVHWKISARLDEIMVKEFENPIRQEGLIILDMAKPASANSKLPDYADLSDYYTDRAAFLVKQLLEHEISSRIVCYQPSGRVEIKQVHPEDLRHLQIMMAGMQWTDDYPAGQVLNNEAQKPGQYWFVLLLSTRINMSAARSLAALKGSGLMSFLVLLQEEPALYEDTSECISLLEGHDIPLIHLYRVQDSN